MYIYLLGFGIPRFSLSLSSTLSRRLVLSLSTTLSHVRALSLCPAPSSPFPMPALERSGVVRCSGGDGTEPRLGAAGQRTAVAERRQARDGLDGLFLSHFLFFYLINQDKQQTAWENRSFTMTFDPMWLRKIPRLFFLPASVNDLCSSVCKIALHILFYSLFIF